MADVIREMTRAELKEYALEHWKDNLKRIKSMDWRNWKAMSYEVRKQLMLGSIDVARKHIKSGHIDTDNFPTITYCGSEYCSQYTNRRCTKIVYRTRRGVLIQSSMSCPLRDKKVQNGDCCSVWEQVSECLLKPEYHTKKDTIKAVQGMIKYIKKRG